MAGFGGGKGQTAPAVDVGRIQLSRLVEDRVGLPGLAQVNEILAVGDEQIGIVGACGEEVEEELVGSGIVGGIGEDRGQHMRNGGVIGVGGVEFLEKREGLGFVLIGEHRGELCVERGVIGIFGEGGAEEGLGARVVFAQDEQMGEAGAGRRGLRIFVEDTAKGGCGGFKLAGLFGKLGGEQRVGCRFRRQLEGFKQVIRGCGGIGVAIDKGECAPGASLEHRIGHAGIESGGNDQFGTGIGELVLAREKQAKREVSLEGVGIGGDGATVESSGVVETILLVGNVAGVEESARIGGMGGEVRVESGFSGLPAGCGDGGFSGGYFGRNGSWSWGGCI